jgi:hypothetical protein
MKLSRCSECRQSKVEVLVYKNGLRRRTRVVQCPNHCDLKCPVCDDDLAVTSISRVSNEKALCCAQCGWDGHSPCRVLFNDRFEEKARIRKQKEEERARNLRILKNQVYWNNDDGPYCPHCDIPLSQVSELVFTDVYGKQQFRIENVCRDGGCGRSWTSHVEAGTVFSKVGARFVDTRSSDGIGSICDSCDQPIRNGSICGCS